MVHEFFGSLGMLVGGIVFNLWENSTMMGGRVVTVFTMLTVIIILVGLGLAVPNLTVNIQEIGSGSCSLDKFMRVANVTVGWEIGPSYWGVSTYTLKNVTLVFSDNVPLANVSVIMVVYGYNINTGSYEEDVFRYDLSNIGIAAGVPYVINNTDSFYSYYGGGIISKPEIKNFTVVIRTPQYLCNTLPIFLNVEGIEIASLDYAPPGVGILNITIHEQSGSNLLYYTVNFTLPGDWSGMYPYITYENGTRLHYWYSYVPSAQRTWFWVEVNLSPFQTLVLQLHYGNSSQYDPNYVNRSEVFWMTSVSSFSLSGTAGSVGTTLFSQFLDILSSLGYDGYTVDINANLTAPSTVYYGPYYLFYNYSDIYIIGSGVTLYSSPIYRIDWIYSVYGNGPYYYTYISYPTLPIGKRAQYALTVTSSGNFKFFSNLQKVADENFPINGVSYYKNFIFGQEAGTSYYYWVGFRPYKNPPPLVEISGVQTSEYSFTLYFRP